MHCTRAFTLAAIPITTALLGAAVLLLAAL